MIIRSLNDLNNIEYKSPTLTGTYTLYDEDRFGTLNDEINKFINIEPSNKHVFYLKNKCYVFMYAQKSGTVNSLTYSFTFRDFRNPYIPANDNSMFFEQINIIIEPQYKIDNRRKERENERSVREKQTRKMQMVMSNRSIDEIGQYEHTPQNKSELLSYSNNRDLKYEKQSNISKRYQPNNSNQFFDTLKERIARQKRRFKDGKRVYTKTSNKTLQDEVYCL